MNKEQINSEGNSNPMNQPLEQLKEQTANTHLFLILWGTILFVFYGFLYLAKQFPILEDLQYYLVLLFPIGAVLSILFSRKTDKTDQPSTTNQRLFMYSWGGAILGVITWLANNVIYQADLYLALTVLLFGLASFITGGTVKFTPLMIGGLLTIIISAIIPAMELSFQYLLSAVGILCSCLIPGLMIGFQIRKKRNSCNVLNA